MSIVLGCRSIHSCLPLENHSIGVEKLLDNINIHKASGPDKIPNIILKTCSKEISPALANIFQQSLDTGTLPNDWKNSNISPILKKGNKHMASNYRPISLTSVLQDFGTHNM